MSKQSRCVIGWAIVLWMLAAACIGIAGGMGVVLVP